MMNPKTFLEQCSEEEKKELNSLMDYMPAYCGGYKLIKNSKSPRDLIETLKELKKIIIHLKKKKTK